MTDLVEVIDLVKVFPVVGRGRRFGWPRWIGGRASRLHAVDGVSFSISDGEAVGLVGESGCGKSTLTRVLSRLLDSSSGTIRFGGTDIGAMPAARFAKSTLRGAIQMVFQDSDDSLNPRFSAFDSIANPVRRLGRGDGRAVADRVALAADRVGLPRELLGRFPHQLSGGQKARVGIARGIVLEPRLLVLDEPTSSLDVSVQALVLALLDRLRRDLGMTYLFVSHDLNVVRLMCDRVLVMYLGQIVESGPADAVFRAPRHPYTHALLSAIPEIDPASRVAKLRLDGEPQSPIDVGRDFCRFAGRCPRASERCRKEMPELQDIATAHAVACHFPLTPPTGE
jgi:oligopeptide/dipeptide ABC transporter ATP-binding protein